MSIYGTAFSPLSCGTKGLSGARVALAEDVIDHRTRNRIGHHDVDIVVSPGSIDVQEGWAHTFEGVAQANCQAITWNILWPNCDFNPMQLQGLKQVVCDKGGGGRHHPLVRG
jgi:hypothetical protein